MPQAWSSVTPPLGSQVSGFSMCQSLFDEAPTTQPTTQQASISEARTTDKRCSDLALTSASRLVVLRTLGSALHSRPLCTRAPHLTPFTGISYHTSQALRHVMLRDRQAMHVTTWMPRDTKRPAITTSPSPHHLRLVTAPPKAVGWW